jgi:hypothetical protein
VHDSPRRRSTRLCSAAADYAAHATEALNPTYDPEQVAHAMVRRAEHGGPGEVIVGCGQAVAVSSTCQIVATQPPTACQERGAAEIGGAVNEHAPRQPVIPSSSPSLLIVCFKARR